MESYPILVFLEKQIQKSKNKKQHSNEPTLNTVLDSCKEARLLA